MGHAKDDCNISQIARIDLNRTEKYEPCTAEDATTWYSQARRVILSISWVKIIMEPDNIWHNDRERTVQRKLEQRFAIKTMTKKQ
jgi:hypothetical protein